MEDKPPQTSHTVPSHGLQLFIGWCNTGPFRGVQSAPLWFLYKVRSPDSKSAPVWAPLHGDPGPARNLLQCRLATGSQSFRHTHTWFHYVFRHGLHVDFCSTWTSMGWFQMWQWNNNTPTCPGFSGDRIHFLPSSQNSAVFWGYYENNIDNTMAISVVAQ